MTHSATPSAGTLLLERPATEQARGQVEDLLTDLRLGDWTPTPLERRVADILHLSAATGALSSRHVRDALWEGALTMTQENGARFATALALLVPVLEEPAPSAPDVAYAAVELLAAIVDHR